MSSGRLNLNAVVLLKPHLTAENADGLLAAAAYRTRSELEHLIAERFPRTDVPTQMVELAARRVENSTNLQFAGPTEPSAQGRIAATDPPARPVPLAPQRFSFQFTMSLEFHDKLRDAEQLTSHRAHRGDPVAVLERALDAYIAASEKRRFARTSRPHRGRTSANARHVPAYVRRAVWARDGGQCTFVSDNGHQCGARDRLEFDHVVPVARGGQATVDGIRLRCRGHNQYEAERTFGVREALAFLGRARFARSTSSEAPGKRPEPPLLHYTPNSSGSQARPSSLGGPM